METLRFRHQAPQRASGAKTIGLVGVVASGNLEVLVERSLSDRHCEVLVRTAVHGFEEVWKRVVADFVERRSPGGLKFSINDGGAQPDTVSLRLAQAARLMEEDAL